MRSTGRRKAIRSSCCTVSLRSALLRRNGAALAARYRVIVPICEVMGRPVPVARTMRSGQQAAMGRDCSTCWMRCRSGARPWSVMIGAVARLHRRGPLAGTGALLVSGDGYNIQDIAGFAIPQPPEMEHRLWYQYYFHGRAAVTGWRPIAASWASCCGGSGRPLVVRRRDLCADAASFDNPDYVDVVIHSYRHRFGYVAGDPALEEIERALAGQPAIRCDHLALRRR